MLRLITEEVAPITRCKNDFEAEVAGEVVVKPNTAGGSVSPSKSGPDYYLAVQCSWSIHPPRDQEPRPTRVVGRPEGWVFFMEVGLKSRNNGLSGPTGVVRTACNSWCIHRLCLMGECATAGTGAGRPDGPI